ncbi:MAG: hypothetical protein LBM09_02020 [Candidatus Nomurabacteria bacterium]|nr:hypothetical protein [Candidatus Nomurabacteria bacterium]
MTLVTGLFRFARNDAHYFTCHYSAFLSPLRGGLSPWQSSDFVILNTPHLVILNLIQDL